jgi:hypothetical protein
MTSNRNLLNVGNHHVVLKQLLEVTKGDIKVSCMYLGFTKKANVGSI